jgi:hypothetical protein
MMRAMSCFKSLHLWKFISLKVQQSHLAHDYVREYIVISHKLSTTSQKKYKSM